MVLWACARASVQRPVECHCQFWYRLRDPRPSQLDSHLHTKCSQCPRLAISNVSKQLPIHAPNKQVALVLAQACSDVVINVGRILRLWAGRWLPVGRRRCPLLRLHKRHHNLHLSKCTAWALDAITDTAKKSVLCALAQHQGARHTLYNLHGRPRAARSLRSPAQEASLAARR